MENITKGFKKLKDVTHLRILIHHENHDSRGNPKLVYEHAGTTMMLNLSKKIAEVLIASGVPYED